MFFVRLAALAALGLVAFVVAAPAQALTLTECSVKYKAAQDAGTLGSTKWTDFRKAECGTEDATITPAAASTTPPPAKPADTGEPTVANTELAHEPPGTNALAPRGVTFPKAIAPQYANETPGKARMHTCRDQYKLNKAGNTLAGLTWIKKGGGYYSLCNSRLKG
ncbi:MAG TPA: hypothetical protein VGO70_08390 [Arsenicitalea sp.]|nr:hypothetical protein [Arsenicitalea sp.]